jgi:hypothetical protein
MVVCLRTSIPQTILAYFYYKFYLLILPLFILIEKRRKRGFYRPLLLVDQGYCPDVSIVGGGVVVVSPSVGGCSVSVPVSLAGGVVGSSGGRTLIGVLADASPPAESLTSNVTS